MMTMSPRYLERVDIVNFRAYGDGFTLSLPPGPGMTLIHGPNGLGKTTFFDAVEWCLTGSISRFGAYLTGAANRRPEYLTRFGAPDGSHRVSLYFSGASPIDRGLGVAPSAEDIIEVLKQPHWPEVSDLGRYLSLTHFLGQSAGQRFSVKDPKEQWDALKGPAGVDRINYIKDRLGGQAAKVAFTRQLRQAQQNLEEKQAALVRWREMADHLHRIRSLSRIRDTLSPSALVDASLTVVQLLEPLLGVATFIFDESGAPEAVLERMRVAIRESQDRVQRELTEVTTLDELAEELERSTTEQRHMAEVINTGWNRHKEISLEVNRVEEQLRAARDEVDNVHKQLTRAQSEVAQLLRLIQVSELHAQGVVRLERTVHDITEVEAELRSMDAVHAELTRTISELTARATEREKLSRDVAEMRAAAEAYREVESLREQLTTTYQGVDAQNSITLLKSEGEALRSQWVVLRNEVEIVEGELAEIDRRSGALFALVQQVAALLQEGDVACPLCTTEFPPGELLRRVVETREPFFGSAQLSGERLVAAYADIAELERNMKVVDNEIQRLNDYLRDSSAVTDREASIIARVQRIIPHVSVTSGSDVLRLADVHEQELAALQLVVESARSIQSYQNELGSLDNSRNEAANRLSILRGESSGIAASLEEARVELTQRSDAWSEVDGLSINVREEQAQAAADVAAAQARLVTAQSTREAVEQQEASGRARLAEVNSVIDALQQKKSTITQRIEQLTAGWNDIAPMLEPSSESAWQMRAIAEDHQRILSDAEQRFQRIVEGYTAWIDDAESQRVEESVRSLLRETGAKSEDDLESHFSQGVEKAAGLVLNIEETRELALTLAGEMQEKADQFARSVLKPLSATIQSYSRTLMTRADETLFYEAKYRANRPELHAGIMRHNQDGSAVTINVNPNLYFSEGQLSALSVSSLLAASTTFSWSRWPALLMDDPLQHNDIIHASAFIDLLRRLIEKLKYQVILSTHDSDEAEFIMRKCESAGITVQTCELRPTRGDGLVSA